MKILIIDNYDSFVYNVAQLIGKLGCEPEVIRNDERSVREIRNMNPDGIVISPGPGTPTEKRDFGVCGSVISELGPSFPILGICLGHQGIVSSFGGKIINAKEIRHGKTSEIQYYSSNLFSNLDNPFIATRYHSLVADPYRIPECLEVTALSIDDHEIMAVKHKKYLIEGVQFHPESVMTVQGPQILLNFINMIKK
ncbi:MAG TPA: aminodeoxychorismate/anthranilate synthase component II [Nitrososphaeraceae archaeon]|nr:aminodeoxychorismate/anthranilate synthase component II [Nitrososphaeraceae archaeon]